MNRLQAFIVVIVCFGFNLGLLFSSLICQNSLITISILGMCTLYGAYQTHRIYKNEMKDSPQHWVNT